MTQRERKLGIIVAVLLGAMLLYGAVNTLALSPARKADEDVRRLEEEAGKLRTANAREGYYKARLGSLKARTFGSDELTARDGLESRLMSIARQSGLSTSSGLTLRSARGAPKRGAYREVAWNVTASGKLDHVVNFLYLLGADSRLHRISGLNLSPQPRREEIKVRLRYSTIIPDLKNPPKIEAPAPTSAPALPGLDGPRRTQLAMITARDLFRPYVKRPPRVVSRPPQRIPDRTDPPPRRLQGPPVETFMRVVSLSQLASQPHICISDTRSGDVQYYKVGDKLAGGRIVLVDYRQMPQVDNPRILSGSRVIVIIGQTYWAVELGRTLAQKHRLRQDQLPLELKVSSAAHAPAESVSPQKGSRLECPARAVNLHGCSV